MAATLITRDKIQLNFKNARLSKQQFDIESIVNRIKKRSLFSAFRLDTIK